MNPLLKVICVHTHAHTWCSISYFHGFHESFVTNKKVRSKIISWNQNNIMNRLIPYVGQRWHLFNYRCQLGLFKNVWTRKSKIWISDFLDSDSDNNSIEVQISNIPEYVYLLIYLFFENEKGRFKLINLHFIVVIL